MKSVPNVVDVNSFGGPTREYQVQIDPGKLVSYGLSLSQVEQALANNNVNAGGGFIERGEQALNVRAVGLMQTTDDIAATVVKGAEWNAGARARSGRGGAGAQGAPGTTRQDHPP